METDILKPIPKDIFLNNDIVFLSKYLLGKYLISDIDGLQVMGKIVETEAYAAPDDKGSHAFRNKRTERTEIMFGEGGIAYVYLCYGLHHMLNVVTAPKETAHAVLIRAVEPLKGLDIMRKRRNGIKSYNMSNGPGKLCQAFGISRLQNGMDLCNSTQEIWLAENEPIEEDHIMCSPRVGIAYAQECANWPWRFRIKKSKWTSPPAHVSY